MADPKPPTFLSLNSVTDTCAQCQYYHAVDERIGRCHRYPPTLVDDGTAGKYSQQESDKAGLPRRWFPSVLASDYCGEFLKR